MAALLEPWFERRVPLMVRDKLALQYRVTRHDVLLFEKRPHWRNAGEWTESHVAKFRFNRQSGLWTLFCRDRNLKWHRYDFAEPSPRLADLVIHVDQDRTGIFWG